MKAARPGMTTGELDSSPSVGFVTPAASPRLRVITDFRGSICASVNDEVVHGIPGTSVLCDGDLLSIDIGTTLDGYVSDSAVTIPIGNVSQTAQRLLEVTRECLTLGIAQMKRGKRLGDIGAAVQAHAEAHGFGVVRELVGHGVGRAMHEEPQVPNYGEAGTGLELRAGLVLAIEPMITQGGPKVRILEDGWTVVTADGKLAAHFEHTIAVTEDGPQILTLRDYAEDPEIERYRPSVILSPSTAHRQNTSIDDETKALRQGSGLKR